MYNKTLKYDVVIVGGGVSGSIAAIAAARNGAKTLVLEKYGFLGGTLTVMGVGPMMTFHAGDTQVVRGIPDEVIGRLKALGASTGHIHDTIGFASSVTPFESEKMKYVLEQMLLEENGEILFHSCFVKGYSKDKNIAKIRVLTKQGLIDLKARVFIDATGDADLAASVGVDYVFGRKEDNLAQPMTMKARFINVNIDEVREYMKNNKEEFLIGDWNKVDTTERLSVSGFYSLLKEAKKNGDITYPRDIVLFFESNIKNEVIVNMTRILGLRSTDSFDLTKAEIKGREQVYETEKFLKKYIPGFKNSKLISTGPQVGVRESRKIEGVYKLTTEDILANRMFEDAVALGGYPVDVHDPSGTGIIEKHLKKGTYYSIPYRAMITNEYSNLIVTGRCICSEHEANAAIRVSPIAMALGQAAGTAAAIASKEGISVQDIDTSALRDTLIKDGAFLG
jgi:hypothetical protein